MTSVAHEGYELRQIGAGLDKVTQLCLFVRTAGAKDGHYADKQMPLFLSGHPSFHLIWVTSMMTLFLLAEDGVGNVCISLIARPQTLTEQMK